MTLQHVLCSIMIIRNLHGIYQTSVNDVGVVRK